jgi:RNA polymerase sigma-70 factor (ECF subfamily)
MEYSDQQLIADYLKGNEESLEILIKRYLKPIYSFVYRYIGNKQEAEDIAQEVFIKTWRNLKRFNQNKNFKTWIFTIAKNTSIDWLRKKKSVPLSYFENEEGENALAKTLRNPAPLPDEIIEQTNIRELLNAAVNQLAPKYRMVLLLRYNDHFTFKEIGKILGQPLNTVKSQHRRALIKLKKILSDT